MIGNWIETRTALETHTHIHVRTMHIHNAQIHYQYNDIKMQN